MWYWDQQTFLNTSFDIKIYSNGNDSDGILFVHHGSSRSTYSSGSDDIAELENLSVYTPIFPEEDFNSREYQRGGVTDSSGNLLPESEWTTRYEEPMLEWARSQYDEDKPVYLFGHSAGGQYLSRVAAYEGVPDYVDRIIIANPSTWVMPTLDEDVPYGFDGFGTPEEELAALEAYLALPITVYLASEDTDPNDPSLATFPAAMRQGETRLERGMNAYTMGEEVAAEYGWDFNWELVIAEGVGHTGSGMLRAPEMTLALAPVDEPANGVPFDIALSGGAVREDAGAGMVVGDLTATDPDGDTVTFEVVDDDRFAVNDLDQLVVASGADLSVDGDLTETIRISADDHHGGVTLTDIQVVIQDVNNAPHDIALQGGTVREDAAGGTVVGQLSAQDADGDAITFDVVDDPRFAVDGSGRLIVADGAGLAVDGDLTETIRISADDHHGGVTLTDIQVVIQDVNNAPHDIALQGGTVREDAAGGTVVGQLSAQDADGDVITFGVVADPRFAVDGSGRLIVADGAGLAVDGDQIETVTIRADDGRGGVTLHEARVSILDVVQPPEPDPIGEAGTVTVSQRDGNEWHMVTFSARLDDPSVVMGGLTNNGVHATTLRVRNVTDTGFEFQLDEWDYLDGSHKAERVSWIAVERGVHRLANGLEIEAGSLSGAGAMNTVGFARGHFSETPTVLAQVTSANDPMAITDRVHNVDLDGFDLRLQGQESAASGSHGPERVDWIAIENGGAAADGLLAMQTGEIVSAKREDVRFDGAFDSDQFAFIDDIQSFNGADTASLRLVRADETGASIFVQEERSGDGEARHVAENVGFIAIQDGLIFDDPLMA